MKYVTMKNCNDKKATIYYAEKRESSAILFVIFVPYDGLRYQMQIANVCIFARSNIANVTISSIWLEFSSYYEQKCIFIMYKIVHYVGPTYKLTLIV